MLRKRSKGFLTRVRYPTYTSYGKRVIRTCERCRQKDGLRPYRKIYGICSFCGRKGRMNMGPLDAYFPP